MHQIVEYTFPLLIRLNLSKCSIHDIKLNKSFAVAMRLDNLIYLDISQNNIGHIPQGTFQQLSRLQLLHLDGNSELSNIEPFSFVGLTSLKVLQISGTRLRYLPNNSFYGLSNVTELDVSKNKIENVGEGAFMGLVSAFKVNISHNRIENTYVILIGLANASVLDLSYNEINTWDVLKYYSRQIILLLDGNKLQMIKALSFESFADLRELYLRGNSIRVIETDAFQGLNSLESLYLTNNQIDVTQNMFSGLGLLQYLYVDTYDICCAKPASVDDDRCFAPRDSIASCENMIAVPFLGACLWILCACALLGNVFVIIYRSIKQRNSKMTTYNLLVLQLSFSDMLMGVYLTVIAIMNTLFSGQYGFEDKQWRYSCLCTFCGVVATLSSEASAMFILYITVDRAVAISNPFSILSFNGKTRYCIIGIIWTMAILISVIPVIDTNTFHGSFYARSSVCISLPLTKHEGRGWTYAFIIFIGLNFMLFLGVAVGQLYIYFRIRRASMFLGTKEQQQQAAVARSLFTVVMTDVLCWIPIALLGGYSTSMGEGCYFVIILVTESIGFHRTFATDVAC